MWEGGAEMKKIYLWTYAYSADGDRVLATNFFTAEDDEAAQQEFVRRSEPWKNQDPRLFREIPNKAQ